MVIITVVPCSFQNLEKKEMFPRLYLSSLFYCASILTPSLVLINLTQPEPRNNLKFDSPPSLIFSTTTYRNSLTSSSFEGREGREDFSPPSLRRVALTAINWANWDACVLRAHARWMAVRSSVTARLDSTRPARRRARAQVRLRSSHWASPRPARCIHGRTHTTTAPYKYS